MNFTQMILPRVVLVICSSLCIPLPAAKAQTPTATPAVRLETTRTRSFESLLQDLSRQANVFFVVEGTPAQSRRAQSMPALENVPLEDAVAKVAAAFDYDVRRSGGAFLLNKKYTDPREMPCVTVPEIEAWLRDTAGILAPFNPHRTSSYDAAVTDPFVASLVPALSPEQQDLLQQGKLAVSDLSAPGRQVIKNFALYFYVQMKKESIDAALVTTAARSKEYVTIGKGRNSGLLVVGGTDKYGQSYETAAEQRTRTRVVDDTVVETSSAVPLEPHKAAAATRTLKEAVAQLSRGSATDIRVDAALAAKPVLLVGTEGKSSMEVLKTLAELYSLRLRTLPDDGGVLLTRRAAVHPVEVVGLSQALFDAVPLPLLHAARLLPTKQAPEAMPAPPPTTRNGQPLSAEELRQGEVEFGKKMQAYLERQQARRPGSQLGELQRGAVLWLRTAIAPQIALDPNTRVPIASLPTADQVAAVLTSPNVIGFLEDIQSFQGSVPSYITHFDDLLLKGGPYKDEGSGEWRYELNFLSPKTGLGPGVSNLRYNPKQ